MKGAFHARPAYEVSAIRPTDITSIVGDVFKINADSVEFICEAEDFIGADGPEIFVPRALAGCEILVFCEFPFGGCRAFWPRVVCHIKSP